MGSQTPAGLVLPNSNSPGPRTFPETQDVLGRYLLSGRISEGHEEGAAGLPGWKGRAGFAPLARKVFSNPAGPENMNHRWRGEKSELSVSPPGGQ